MSTIELQINDEASVLEMARAWVNHAEGDGLRDGLAVDVAELLLQVVGERDQLRREAEGHVSQERLAEIQAKIDRVGKAALHAAAILDDIGYSKSAQRVRVEITS